MNGQAVELKGIYRDIKQKHILKDINMKIDEGEFMTILGPSGAGKTTILRLIAGFDEATKGSIMINEQDVTGVPTNKRNIGVLFQNYALFPHMTVAENVAYPLKIRKISKSEREHRVYEALKMVRLEKYLGRYPRELSGGQQQRVALARALIFNPSVLLLDEPMAALDKQLRKYMQLEIKNLQEKLGITTISVTHDQEEALTMASKVCVLKNGQVEQISDPHEIYDKPKNTFIAKFIGETNIYETKIVDKLDCNYNSYFTEGIRSLANKYNIKMNVQGAGGLVSIQFGIDRPLIDYRDCLDNVDKEMYDKLYFGCLKYGVRLMPEKGRTYITTAHTKEDIDRTLEVFEMVFKSF